jgi:hypothetical protein
MKNTRALVAIVLLGWVLPAAADQPLSGHSLLLKTTSPGRPALKLFIKDGGFAVPAPASANDPRTGGATLRLKAASGETASLDLPAAGWKLDKTGTGYKFKNPNPAGPVKSAVARGGKSLKLTALTSGITLDEPSQGSVSILFVMGTSGYCSTFGGKIRADSTGLFSARGAPAPGACEPRCGDAVIETGEQCDTPGTSCGAGATCSADCTCPCDFLDPSLCLYPFPNDWLTVADPTTDTGRRVHFATAGMPQNGSGTPMGASDYNQNDGFSPGSSVLLHVPNVDLTMTGAAPITDVARSLDADAPIVIVNASTHAHHPFWAELDANATTEPATSLILRPAISLDEASRYIVALRRMKDGTGATIAPNPDFVAYRDGTPTGDPVKEARRAHMEDIFTTLGDAGVDRSDLYLAWDFTVASSRNLTERLLFMRDDAFTRLGTSAPSFTVTQVENDLDSQIYRRVTGTYYVDRYVDSTSAPARLVLDSNGVPVHQATPQPASFICTIPRAALANATAAAVPGRAAIYGHGLLGSNDEVNAGNVKAMCNEHNFVYCATKWIGMADEDTVNAILILRDLSRFPSFPDRQQQGMVDQLYLARLMIDPHGFVSDPAFQDAFGAPVIDTRHVFYDGNSQGGIFGGTVMAISQDIKRGVLGVPGMNYSLLLTRSTDFASYSAILYPAYPSELERPLLLALIQMLWDRSEPNGYAHHMTTDPLPNTPPHEVLMHVAFGDHQVSTVAAEVEARTIGAYIHQPAIAPGRNPDVTPYYGIPAIPSSPFDGSAMVVWDSGAATPPITNTAPMVGFDPHPDPRNSPLARTQKSDFLDSAEPAFIDVCGGLPCTATH